MNKLKDLKVWQKSIDVAIAIYRLTKDFPSEEKFGLVSQMNRCSVSISSNIAEGCGRNSKKEFSQFLSIANGSAYELETQLLISSRLNYISDVDYKTINIKVEEIQKMIYGLKSNLRLASQDSGLKTHN